MSRIIDLSAIHPDDIVIKLKNDTYTIPATISVNYITKIMKLNEKKAAIKDSVEYFDVLKEIALTILSLDTSKKVTMKTIETELDDMKLLIALPQLFDEQMTKAITESIPQNPNAKSPTVK